MTHSRLDPTKPRARADASFTNHAARPAATTVKRRRACQRRGHRFSIRGYHGKLQRQGGGASPKDERTGLGPRDARRQQPQLGRPRAFRTGGCGGARGACTPARCGRGYEGGGAWLWYCKSFFSACVWKGTVFGRLSRVDWGCSLCISPRKLTRLLSTDRETLTLAISGRLQRCDCNEECSTLPRISVQGRGVVRRLRVVAGTSNTRNARTAA